MTATCYPGLPLPLKCLAVAGHRTGQLFEISITKYGLMLATLEYVWMRGLSQPRNPDIQAIHFRPTPSIQPTRRDFMQERHSAFSFCGAIRLCPGQLRVIEQSRVCGEFVQLVAPRTSGKSMPFFLLCGLVPRASPSYSALLTAVSVIHFPRSQKVLNGRYAWLSLAPAQLRTQNLLMPWLAWWLESPYLTEVGTPGKLEILQNSPTLSPVHWPGGNLENGLGDSPPHTRTLSDGRHNRTPGRL
jgi:hypothetical protein